MPRRGRARDGSQRDELGRPDVSPQRGFVASEADTMHGDRANPHGYYENWRIYRANEQVLAHLDGTWFDTPNELQQLSLDAEQTRCLTRELAVLLDAAGRSPLVLKDPRIGMLMPLWWPLLAGVLHPVLVVRHPLEVALSLEQRDCTALPVGLAMWELHLVRLLGALDGERVTVIPYQRVLDDVDLAERLVGEASRELAPGLRQAVQPDQARSGLEPGPSSQQDGRRERHTLVERHPAAALAAA
jgi:hypothetical protein